MPHSADCSKFIAFRRPIFLTSGIRPQEFPHPFLQGMECLLDPHDQGPPVHLLAVPDTDHYWIILQIQCTPQKMKGRKKTKPFPTPTITVAQEIL